jgi:hypothetical protein
LFVDFWGVEGAEGFGRMVGLVACHFLMRSRDGWSGGFFADDGSLGLGWLVFVKLQ